MKLTLKPNLTRTLIQIDFHQMSTATVNTGHTKKDIDDELARENDVRLKIQLFNYGGTLVHQSDTETRKLLEDIGYDDDDYAYLDESKENSQIGKLFIFVKC